MRTEHLGRGTEHFELGTEHGTVRTGQFDVVAALFLLGLERFKGCSNMLLGL